jgi:hypothetical protein
LWRCLDFNHVSGLSVLCMDNKKTLSSSKV